MDTIRRLSRRIKSQQDLKARAEPFPERKRLVSANKSGFNQPGVPYRIEMYIGADKP